MPPPLPSPTGPVFPLPPASADPAAAPRPSWQARRILSVAALTALGLFTGACCPCGAADTLLCRDCAATLTGPVLRVDDVPPRLQLVEVHTDLDSPVRTRPLLPIAAAGLYDGALRDVVLAFKNRGSFLLAGALGAAVGRAVAALPDVRDCVLVPVPSSAAARARRREEPTTLLTRATARAAGLPWAASLMLRGDGPHQATLTGRSRAGNRQRAVQVRRGPVPARAIVVDDVLTTGSTLRGAVEALRAAGCDVTGAAVLALTPPPSGTLPLPSGTLPKH